MSLCEIQGVTCSFEGQSCSMYMWHSSLLITVPALSTLLRSLSAGLLVVHDHPSAPVIMGFQAIALTSRCGSFWKVHFVVKWEMGDKGLRGEYLWMCASGNITATFALPWSALSPDCLLPLKRASSLPTAASKVTCFDPPGKSDYKWQASVTDAFISFFWNSNYFIISWV